MAFSFPDRLSRGQLVGHQFPDGPVTSTAAAGSGWTELISSVRDTSSIEGSDFIWVEKQLDGDQTQGWVLSPDGDLGLIGTSRPCFLRPLPTHDSPEALWVASDSGDGGARKIYYKRNVFDQTPPLVVADTTLLETDCNKSVYAHRIGNSLANHVFEISSPKGENPRSVPLTNLWHNRLVNGAFVSEQVVFDAPQAYRDDEAFYSVELHSTGSRSVVYKYSFQSPETPEVFFQSRELSVIVEPLVLMNEAVFAPASDSIFNRATAEETGVPRSRYSDCIDQRVLAVGLRRENAA